MKKNNIHKIALVGFLGMGMCLHATLPRNGKGAQQVPKHKHKPKHQKQGNYENVMPVNLGVPAHSADQQEPLYQNMAPTATPVTAPPLPPRRNASPSPARSDGSASSRARTPSPNSKGPRRARVKGGEDSKSRSRTPSPDYPADYPVDYKYGTPDDNVYETLTFRTEKDIRTPQDRRFSRQLKGTATMSKKRSGVFAKEWAAYNSTDVQAEKQPKRVEKATIDGAELQLGTLLIASIQYKGKGTISTLIDGGLDKFHRFDRDTQETKRKLEEKRDTISSSPLAQISGPEQKESYNKIYNHIENLRHVSNFDKSDILSALADPLSGKRAPSSSNIELREDGSDIAASVGEIKWFVNNGQPMVQDPKKFSGDIEKLNKLRFNVNFAQPNSPEQVAAFDAYKKEAQEFAKKVYTTLSVEQQDKMKSLSVLTNEHGGASPQTMSTVEGMADSFQAALGNDKDFSKHLLNGLDPTPVNKNYLTQKAEMTGNLRDETRAARQQISEQYRQQAQVVVNFNGKQVSYSNHHARYGNIITADKTDVGEKYGTNGNKLTPTNGVSSELLLAQFPQNSSKESNVPQFVDMLRGEGVGRVVVLTETAEMNDNKSKKNRGPYDKTAQESYFKEGTHTYTDPKTNKVVTVQSTLISAEPLGNEGDRKEITVKTYEIQTVDSKGNRHKTELVQFDGWVDKTPVTSSTVLKMVQKIGTPPNGVTCIHCSAGVGRTSTFAAAKMMSEQARNGITPDASEIMAKLREERSPYAVQTDEQENTVLDFATHIAQQ